MLLKFPAYQHSKAHVLYFRRCLWPAQTGHPRHVGKYLSNLRCILPELCNTGSKSSRTERLLHLKQHDT